MSNPVSPSLSRRVIASSRTESSSSSALYANRLHCASRETSLATLARMLPRDIWIRILDWLDETL